MQEENHRLKEDLRKQKERNDRMEMHLKILESKLDLLQKPPEQNDSKLANISYKDYN